MIEHFPAPEKLEQLKEKEELRYQPPSIKAANNWLCDVFMQMPRHPLDSVEIGDAVMQL